LDTLGLSKGGTKENRRSSVKEGRSAQIKSQSKFEKKIENMSKLQNTMRWGWMTIVKLVTGITIVAMLVFSAILVHVSLRSETLNLRDLGEFCYNYWLGFGIFVTGLIAVAGGNKAIQSFSNRKGEDNVKN
jgi:hypothetical protein